MQFFSHSEHKYLRWVQIDNKILKNTMQLSKLHDNQP